MVETNSNMYVINLFGGPSTGKSTLAALLFGTLKSKYDLNCEYINEYAKDLVYEKRNQILLNDQLYIFAKQNHKLLMIKESKDVDFVINDSPLLLSNVFGKLRVDGGTSKLFQEYVRETFNSYSNLNFLIERNESFFRTSGRVEKNVDDAKIIDKFIEDELILNNSKYFKIKNDINDILTSDIFKDALKRFKNV